MEHLTRIELLEVMERASFRAFCAKKKTGPEYAWFVQDELRIREQAAIPCANR